MKLSCYPDTDSLYIDLSEKTSVESREISEGSCWITTKRALWLGSTLTMPVRKSPSKN